MFARMNMRMADLKAQMLLLLDIVYRKIKALAHNAKGLGGIQRDETGRNRLKRDGTGRNWP
jgi:hypothetical protein